MADEEIETESGSAYSPRGEFQVVEACAVKSELEDGQVDVAGLSDDLKSNVVSGLVVACLMQSLLAPPSIQPDAMAPIHTPHMPIQPNYTRTYTQALTPPGVKLRPMWAGASILSSLMSMLGIRRLRAQGVSDTGFAYPSEVSPFERTIDPARVLGAALLVAGGAVGAGIVALPIKTAAMGFLPSAAALIFGWGLMFSTALLLIEVNKYCGPGANFTTMAERTLGPAWKAVCVALYVTVYGATLTAYMSESSVYLAPWLAAFTGINVPPQIISALFTLGFGTTIYLGSEAVDRTNSLCLAVALGSFAMLAGMSGGVVDTTSLLYAKWGSTIKTLPLVVVAFTFHNMIPSLFKYLGSARAVRSAVFLGTLIPLIMYLTWEALILASLPAGAMLGSVSDIVSLLATSAGSHVAVTIQVFCLFAIITSFLGVGMGCVDFLRDLMHQDPKSESGRNQLKPLLLTLVPPLLVAWACPSLFMGALEVSGILRLVLFCLMPVFMAKAGPWKSRQSFMQSIVLGGTVLTSSCIIAIELIGKIAVL